MDVNSVLERFAPMVRKIAYSIPFNRGSTIVDRDDLIQAGMIGLMRAAGKFDEDSGAQFITYAYRCVWGSMMDELRTHDALPRGARSEMSRVESMTGRLRNLLGREPNRSEVAEAMGITVGELEAARVTWQSGSVRFCEMRSEDSVDDNPWWENGQVDDVFDQVERAERIQEMINGVRGLHGRGGEVLRMYHDEGMGMGAIGTRMGISESRVSQIYTIAVQTLKRRIEERS